MNIKIHTLGIKGSEQKQEGEDADAMFYSIIEIDGHVIDRISSVRVLASGEGLSSVMVRFIPGELDVVTHTGDSWKALLERVPA